MRKPDTPAALALESEALLTRLKRGERDVAAGKVRPVAEVVARLRAKRPVRA
ncbi:MAG TPA: hypothetical protein VIT92_17025 [Burkholderiaceae bacterium]